MSFLSPPAPLLGTVLRTFRQTRALSVKQMAQHLNLPLERLRSLEQDASLPTADELTLLAVGLSQPTHLLWRSIKESARYLLDEALHPPFEAVAARPVLVGPEDVTADAVSLFPPAIRMALSDAFCLPRQDFPALQQAWAALAASEPAHQRIVLDAAVAQLILEGEDEEPLFS